MAVNDIKALVKTKTYYDHFELNSLGAPSISIVMTACNRSKQTYYTLNTFMESSVKDIQVVLVDDSDIDPIELQKLKIYPFNIDFIRIKKGMKNWLNPCVNYNIGFQFIQGAKVVIQNAEVSHVGDVFAYIEQHVDNSQYYVFDVKASFNYTTNERIYESSKHTIGIYEQFLWLEWYQSASIPERNNKYHFLTAMDISVFKKIGGFSYDYALGSCFDDNDLLLKITTQHIPIVTVDCAIANCGGIHLYHVLAGEGWAKNQPSNEELFLKKRDYFEQTGKYIEISEGNKSLNLCRLGMKKPCVVTITGIRPDFIRMSMIFKELDARFHHILIHTGQHYDELLSDVFFKDLEIRKPDYILDAGKSSSNHYEQLGYLSVAIPKLFKEHSIQPDLVLFLGDSNSAAVSLPLKKEGYTIGHIEAGMRSYDKRMLEELNRTTCDHCSDILFVYHEDYKEQILRENIKKNVFVVGNTIVEPLMLFKEMITTVPKRKDMILLDIHRPENFNDIGRLVTIFKFANDCSKKYGLRVKMLYFKRLDDMIRTHSLEIGSIIMVPLMPYKTYLDTVYHSRFIISDSGTGQEEPALLGTPVVVPRDYSERPQSYTNNCSVKFSVERYNNAEVFHWIEGVETGALRMNTEWLGDGKTSKRIVDHLDVFFHGNN
jgi:UDP-N-acetylglucosamine 2-epimerase (non-hydrolysing)